MPSAMLKMQVQNLSLRYGPYQVLTDISFDLHQGEVVVLLGASGSGKTTLLRAVAGLEEPCAGRIAIDDKDVFNVGCGINRSPEARDLGMVFQSYALWPHRTVGENVGFGLGLRSVAPREVEARVREIAGTLGLDTLLGRFPHQLSGGQQQRVALARALVYRPPVILMDEPLSNLDAQLREEAKTWLKRVMIELKLSAVLVTHDQSEAMAMGDKIILLAAGRIEQSGTPQEVYDQPRSPFSANFFGTNNNLHGRLREARAGQGTVEVNGHGIAGRLVGDIPVGAECVATIKAECVRLTPAAGVVADGSTFRRLTSMYLGSRWDHLLQCGSQLLRVYTQAHLVGDEYAAEFPADSVRIFPRPKPG